MNRPGPMRDRERELVEFAVEVALREGHMAILEEVSHIIEDICEVPWWRPIKKWRLKQEMNLGWRLMEAFRAQADAQ